MASIVKTYELNIEKQERKHFGNNPRGLRFFVLNKLVNGGFFMVKEELDIEFCKVCEEIYAIRAEIWIYFDYFDGETFHSDDEIACCPTCYQSYRRYSGYLGALKRRESSGFIEYTLEGFEDLTDKSIRLLRRLMTEFSVPSFTVSVNGDERQLFSELEKKRYISIALINNEVTIVTLNAYKLGLFDNVQILLRTNNQQSFITSPGNLQKDRRHTLRRKARKEALVDDFTTEERLELIDRFGGKCALTGKEVDLHLDHVIPLSIGRGGTTKANMLPVWQRINSSKNNRNIFEWYENNGERFGVVPELFDKAIEYLAELNGMTVAEYRDYVYECHANPNDNLTEVL